MDISTFLAALAAADISVETADLVFAPSTTFPWPARALAVVRPASRQEAARVAAIAGRTGCPIHPVSRGRNWGLGARLPVRDAVLVDLSRLDRIIDLDPEGGTALVEPGVTFEQLQHALAGAGLAHHVPGFGGPTDASVLANALERGEGTGVAGDRFGGVFDLEIALSTGEHFHTGFTRFATTTAARYHGRPAGPLIDGLFSQSGLGLVLAGRVTLNPTRQWNRAVQIELGHPEALGAAIAALRYLLHGGICMPHDIALWNGAKRASSFAAGREAIAAAMAGPSAGWGASLILSADDREMFDAKGRVVERVFADLSLPLQVADDRLEDGTRIPSHLTGFSHGGNVASAYAGKSRIGATPLDPDRDGCGFLWLCPVVPFEPEALLGVERMIGEATADTGIFGAFGLQCVSGRAVHGYVSLAWDRLDPEADGRAMPAHDALAARLSEAGYGAFRLAHPSIAAVPASPGYARIVDRLAQALDPAGVMSPGKIPGR